MTTIDPIQPGMSVATVLLKIAEATGIPALSITGPERTRRVCYARFLAMAGIRVSHPSWALVDISEAVGRGDHGTIYHGLNRYRELYDTDREFRRLALECGLPQRLP